MTLAVSHTHTHTFRGHNNNYHVIMITNGFSFNTNFKQKKNIFFTTHSETQ